VQLACSFHRLVVLQSAHIAWLYDSIHTRLLIHTRLYPKALLFYKAHT
jgi:hypothetical protein